MDPENRNNYPIPPRSCSFCRRRGHNILTCNDIQLRDFEVTCFRYISSITNRNYMESQFRNFLISEWLYYENYVRSFAIRYCRAPSRGNIEIYINTIIIHFLPVIEYRRIILSSEIIESSNEQINTHQTIPIIDQTSRTEEHLPLNIRNFINNSPNVSQSNQTTSMAYRVLFMEMIMSIHESVSNQNRKFDIKMNICEETKEELSKKCECNICYEENENVTFIKFDCGHKFCKDCVKKSLQNEIKQNYCCAYCRKEIKEFQIHESAILNELNNYIK